MMPPYFLIRILTSPSFQRRPDKREARRTPEGRPRRGERSESSSVVSGECDDRQRARLPPRRATQRYGINAAIQSLDSGLRRNDGEGNFYITQAQNALAGALPSTLSI